MKFHRACDLDEIEPGKLLKLKLGGEGILLARDLADKVWAFQSVCTHADRELFPGPWDPSTCEITCPVHRAVFAVANQGAVKVGPAVTPLPVFPVEIRQTESGRQDVWVGLEEC